MPSARYVALLRGINVGGRNKLPMADLRAALDADGYDDVATYIQSGNVALTTDRPQADLEPALQATIQRDFGYDLFVVVRSAPEIEAVFAHAPDGFGAEPDRCRYDVAFLKAPLTAAEALAETPLREGIERAWAGPGVLYIERITAQASKGYLSKLTAKPVYQHMTLRNWNTTTKLRELVGA